MPPRAACKPQIPAHRPSIAPGSIRSYGGNEFLQREHRRARIRIRAPQAAAPAAVGDHAIACGRTAASSRSVRAVLVSPTFLLVQGRSIRPCRPLLKKNRLTPVRTSIDTWSIFAHAPSSICKHDLLQLAELQVRSTMAQIFGDPGSSGSRLANC